MKRVSESDSLSSDCSTVKRRKVSLATYQKWKAELDQECNTLSWLDCETSGVGAKKTVEKLKCKVCVQYQSSIEGRRNYSDKWISGANSVRTSNIRDHSRSDQHAHAMLLLRKSQAQARGLDATAYAPIAKALHQMSEGDRQTLGVKFDIAHFVAIQQLAFTNYPALCELEAKHGVDVGTAYRNQNAGKTFCHFIAESRRQQLIENLSNAQFFSLLMDGSTDTANIDDEMFLVLWCDVDHDDQLVHTNMNYFCVSRPRKVDGQGLFDCVEDSLRRLGIQAIDSKECQMLIGIGTDGASANIAAAGLKGLIEKEVPWLYWSWCLAHRVELAVKDALKGTSFDLIDDMLLRLYYIYEKSPKKCRELEEIIDDLKHFIQFDDAGIKPVRASGSRWVSHKLSAMKRVISKFGAYSSHLIALSEDSSIKPVDRAKLRGYSTKWANAKYILGCAFYSDLLSPCALYSKVLQNDSLDILGAFTSLLRTVQELNKLSSKSLQQWPTYSSTLKSITQEDGKQLYQQQLLKNFAEAEHHFSSHCEEYCTSVTSCLRSRLEWTDLEFVRDVILFLATQGWQKLADEDSQSEPSETIPSYIPAIGRLCSKFKIPLEAAGVVVAQIVDEFHDMLLYATQFISLSSTNYQAVWWKLFHSPNASDWTNALKLARLLFSLPVSNGKLERVFSTMKNIKQSKRSSMSNELLDDLLIINVEKVNIADFKADDSIELWWKAKTRRPNQQQRKDYKKKQREIQDNSDTDSDLSDTNILEDWDNWMDDYCDS